MGTDEKSAPPSGEEAGTIGKNQPKKNGAAETWLWMWEISNKPVPTVEMNLPIFSNSQSVILVYNFLKKFKVFLIFTLLFDVLAIYAIATPYTYIYHISINKIPLLQNTNSLLGRVFLCMTGVVWLCGRLALYISRQTINRQDIIYRLYYIFVIIFLLSSVEFARYVTRLEKYD